MRSVIEGSARPSLEATASASSRKKAQLDGRPTPQERRCQSDSHGRRGTVGFGQGWHLPFNCITLSGKEVIMGANALVQTRIDADVRDRASAVLEAMGLTVSDVVRILLTRTANEGALPLELVTNSEAHDAWFRAKVREALRDIRPDIPDDQAEAHFAARRAAARRKADAGS